jgi:predicted transcriptional regulator
MNDPNAAGIGGFFALVGAVVGALVTGFFAWLAQRRKSDGDVEVAVLAEWQKLNGAMSDRLTTVEREFAEYRSAMAAEIAELHKKYRLEIEEMRKQHRAEMQAMRELNEGLQRAIAQNSRSTVHLIERDGKNKGDGK